MIDAIRQVPVPQWLSSLDAKAITNGSIPLRNLLNGCLYYPASGDDGDPVKHLAGNVHSFIYVDYGKTEQEIVKRIERPGFRGYRVLARRRLNKADLAPRNLRLNPPRPDDGDLSRMPRAAMASPWGSWWVFDRLDGFPDTHGPLRFSLIFVCGDGVASYQALFGGNNAVPLIVAIIQPGTGFGGNWTDFREPNKIFYRSVMEDNSAGQPCYLLYGGWGKRDSYRTSCWPEYSYRIWEHTGQRQLGDRDITQTSLTLWGQQGEGQKMDPDDRKVIRKTDSGQSKRINNPFKPTHPWKPDPDEKIPPKGFRHFGLTDGGEPPK